MLEEPENLGPVGSEVDAFEGSTSDLGAHQHQVPLAAELQKADFFTSSSIFSLGCIREQ